MTSQFIGLSFVLAAAVIEALSNVAFKQAAANGCRPGGVRVRLLGIVMQYRHITYGVVYFIISALLWTVALHCVDVSVAYPASSLELIVIALLTGCGLKEKIGLRRWIGLGTVGLGTIMVGLSW